MQYGRVYIVPFNAVSISAVQDLIYLAAADDMPIVLRKFVVSPDTSETNQQIKITIRRLPATVTVGSGGATVTPVPVRSGDAAASFTARRNDTTQATTSGTALHLNPESFPSQGGFEYLPDIAERPTFKQGEACVIAIEENPSATMSGYAVVEEIG